MKLTAPNAQPEQVNPAVQLLMERSQQQLNSPLFDQMSRQTKASVDPTIPENPSGYGMDSWGAPQATGYNDDWKNQGFADNVPRSLIGTESGGNWGAQNNIKGSGGKNGHYGILQFGHARLEDARRAGVIPADMTADQFKVSKQAQVAASNWHFNDIDGNIRKRGYDRLVGQSINGTPITWDGMRSMAHLGGFGGLSKFITSGGKYNPSDAFGTSLSAYGRTHQG